MRNEYDQDEPLRKSELDEEKQTEILWDLGDQVHPLSSF
jgi:hypothetical protein